MRAFARRFSGVVAAACLVATPAWAESQSGLSVYAACTTPPTKAESEAAHGAFIAGKGSFDEADYVTAINYFKDAYRRDCTKNELLTIIARAYELKGDRAEAINALETYLQRTPATDTDKDQIQKRINNLKAQLAPPPTTPATAPSTLTPPVAPEANADSGATHHSAAPWLVAGAGGVVAITGVVLIVVGKGKISDATALCDATAPSGGHGCIATPGGLTAEQKQSQATSLQASGNTFLAAGGILGGLGLLAVGGGLVWHFLEPAENPRAAITPVAAPGYAGLSLGGRF